ncbi:MAG: hypothetical protein JOZ22_19490, partial [Acidobacteriia bacterium]|nr:hypothetical protein [Terriglobia bacterium]
MLPATPGEVKRKFLIAGISVLYARPQCSSEIPKDTSDSISFRTERSLVIYSTVTWFWEVIVRLRTLRLGILAGLNCLGLIAQISNGTSPAGARERIGRHHAGPIRDKTERTKGLADSTNWSGYAVLGSSFTSAAGSWVVPAAVCYAVSGDQYSSFWVGLDGYESNTVEQIGTDSDCVGTTPIYYAWYEFYPRNAFEILTVPV